MELPAQPEFMPAWLEITAELRRVVGDSTYEIWLSALEPRAWDGTKLLIQAPPATQTWVAKRFGALLERCAQAVIGSAIEVAFAGASRDRAGGSSSALPAPNDQAEPFNPRYTFEQFIIGDSNRLAHAASLAIAELPGQAYNPVFIHAPPGLGKTHLLHAIGNYALAYDSRCRVRYTTVEAFTNAFITALGTRSLGHFKSAYRDTDILLIDDVQFLASKAKTEEEFFHTFNALYESGRQLVLTCDRLPRQLSNIEERLRERFEAGLVASIEPPDFATRVAILRKRAALDRIPLADIKVLELIAAHVTANIRALEGALIRVVASHSLTGRPINLELARTVLGPSPARESDAASELTIASIQALVASYYNLSVEELLSPSRVARVVWPRQLAIYLCRTHTDESLQAIGETFGGRNHATVLHACKRVEKRINIDGEALRDLQVLNKTLQQDNNDRAG